MGTIQHKALVVVGDEDTVARLYKRAQRLSSEFELEGEARVLMSDLQRAGNGYYTFAVLPSGSKVGWPGHQNSVRVIDEIEKQAGRHEGFVTTARVEWGELTARYSVDGEGGTDD